MLDNSPHTKVDAALDKLEHALTGGDIDAAVNLFQADCYWRDLVTFTWNFRTLEGHDQIREMLTNQLAAIKPDHFRQDKNNPASEGDGVTDGWFEFETDVARGYGHVRLKNGLIWTLLTTMTELKGHEEPKGPMRPMGAEHGSDPSRKTWKEKREQEAADLGYATQPYVVIIGGGQGGIALGARLRQLGVPAIIIEKNERPATVGASVTSRSACTIRSGTTIFRIFHFQTTGRYSLPRTRSAIGWKCTRRLWS
jgi:putative flavoprotein involved in K+ transport